MSQFEKTCLVVLIALAVVLSATCFVLHKRAEVKLTLAREGVHAKAD